METKNTPLHQLFQKLIAEEKLDPTLAQILLEEILKILEKQREK